jgi:calcineurin-like phosphoesterase family protein
MKWSSVANLTAALLLSWIPDGAGQGAQVEQPIGILLAAGDVAKCGNKPRHLMDEATAALLVEQVKDADARNIPVHVLVLGDLAYDHGSVGNFKCFDDSWGALNNLTLVHNNVAGLLLPVPGNHEYEQPGPAGPYYDYFASKRNPWVFQQEKVSKSKRTTTRATTLSSSRILPTGLGTFSRSTAS